MIGHLIPATALERRLRDQLRLPRTGKLTPEERKPALKRFSRYWRSVKKRALAGSARAG